MAPLNKESKTVKVNYILIWAGKSARYYINSRPDVDKADLMKILEELQGLDPNQNPMKKQPSQV